MKQVFKPSLLALCLLFSYSLKTNAHSSSESYDNDVEQTKTNKYETNTSLILLDRDSYKTYKDHWAYLSDDEYFGTDTDASNHFDDTISIGMFNNDEQCGLVDSLRLDKEWLCINFSNLYTTNSCSLLKAVTKSFSYNDVIDFVPITMLIFEKDKKEELCRTDIAFRGNYHKSEFDLSRKVKLSASEIEKVVSVLKQKVKDINAIPPRPMASDTLLLQDIYKIDTDIVVAKYNATQYSDSDSDLGNQTVFVLKNNEVIDWFGGMNIYCVPFELKGIQYFYVSENTYATVRTTLLRLNGDSKIIYKKVLFFD